MRNPAQLLRLKKQWDGFASRHPKLLRYLIYVSDNSLEEGALLDLTVTDPEGKALHANARLTAEDVVFLTTLRAVLDGKEQP